MNKNETMNRMNELYQQLSESKQNTFSRIVNKLLSVNYLCGKKRKDADDYYFISSNSELFELFLSILDFNFYINKGDLIVYIINNNNYNHVQLKKLESVVLLVLRKMYFEKSNELQDTDSIVFTLGELHKEIETTGLLKKRINQTTLEEVFKFLINYNICDRIGELKDDETKIILYPTINYIISVSKIEEVISIIKSYEKGETDEDINENQID